MTPAPKCPKCGKEVRVTVQYEAQTLAVVGSGGSYRFVAGRVPDRTIFQCDGCSWGENREYKPGDDE